MRNYIDVNLCCQSGLSILWDKWKAWGCGDNRALLKLRPIEEDHLRVCQKCNPELLADALFARVGSIRISDV